MHWSFSKSSLCAADGGTVQSNCFKLERNIDNHGDIAKINSAKFANFGAVNRENKFGENLCSKGNKYKIIF